MKSGCEEAPQVVSACRQVQGNILGWASKCSQSNFEGKELMKDNDLLTLRANGHTFRPYVPEKSTANNQINN